MQILRTACAAAVALTAAAQTSIRPEVVMVSAVPDGQTIVVGHGRVRLAGITAPRIGRRGDAGEPFAKAARERLEGIVIRRYVRLQFEPGGRAFVLLEDGTCVNATLLREGLAAAARTTAPSPRSGACSADELRRAEAEARALRRGIWSSRHPAT